MFNYVKLFVFVLFLYISIVYSIGPTSSSCSEIFDSVSEIIVDNAGNKVRYYRSKSRISLQADSSLCFSTTSTNNQTNNYYLDVVQAGIDLVLDDFVWCSNPSYAYKAYSTCNNVMPTECYNNNALFAHSDFNFTKIMNMPATGCGFMDNGPFSRRSTTGCVKFGMTHDYRWAAFKIADVHAHADIAIYKNGDIIDMISVDTDSEQFINKGDFNITLRPTYIDPKFYTLKGKMLAQDLFDRTDLRIIENYNALGDFDFRKFCFFQMHKNKTYGDFSDITDQFAVQFVDVYNDRASVAFKDMLNQDAKFKNSKTLFEYTGLEWQAYDLQERALNDKSLNNIITRASARITEYVNVATTSSSKSYPMNPYDYVESCPEPSGYGDGSFYRELKAANRPYFLQVENPSVSVGPGQFNIKYGSSILLMLAIDPVDELIFQRGYLTSQASSGTDPSGNTFYTFSYKFTTCTVGAPQISLNYKKVYTRDVNNNNIELIFTSQGVTSSYIQQDGYMHVHSMNNLESAFDALINTVSLVSAQEENCNIETFDYSYTNISVTLKGTTDQDKCEIHLSSFDEFYPDRIVISNNKKFESKFVLTQINRDHEVEISACTQLGCKELIIDYAISKNVDYDLNTYNYLDPLGFINFFKVNFSWSGLKEIPGKINAWLLDTVDDYIGEKAARLLLGFIKLLPFIIIAVILIGCIIFFDPVLALSVIKFIGRIFTSLFSFLITILMTIFQTLFSCCLKNQGQYQLSPRTKQITENLKTKQEGIQLFNQNLRQRKNLQQRNL